MEKELIQLIDDVIRFGMERSLDSKKNVHLLQKSLVQIYLFYLNNDFPTDDTEYKDFDKNEYLFIPDNVRHNFPEFAYYKTFKNVHDLNDMMDIVSTDPIENLTQIIYDLLEAKWRMENNSTYDGFDFFDFIFEINTEQNILNLLNYLKRDV